MKVNKMSLIISIIVSLVLTFTVLSCAGSTPAPASLSPGAPSGSSGLTSPTTSASHQPSQTQVIKWRGQVAALGPPIGHFKVSGYSIPQVHWANWIKEASKGRLEIELVTAGTLVPQNEVVSAVGKGVMQFARNYGTWSAGILPETNIEVGMPFIAEELSETWDWLYSTGINDLFIEAYAQQNVYPIIYPTGSISHIGAKFPMDTPDTIKGKKIRGMGVMEDYIKVLGGSPVSIAWNDTYMGLKLGTIDGYVGGFSGLEDIKLKEVLTHYVIVPNLSATISSLVINRDALKALPDDLQLLITRDTKYVLNAAAYDIVMAERYMMAHIPNMTFQNWSAGDIATVRQKSADAIWPKLATPNARCAKIMDLTRAWAKEYGKIK